MAAAHRDITEFDRSVHRVLVRTGKPTAHAAATAPHPASTLPWWVREDAGCAFDFDFAVGKKFAEIGIRDLLRFVAFAG